MSLANRGRSDDILTGGASLEVTAGIRNTPSQIRREEHAVCDTEPNWLSSSGQTTSAAEGAAPTPRPTRTAALQTAGLTQPAGGVCCEACNARLVELKKQALRLMMLYSKAYQQKIGAVTKDSGAVTSQVQDTLQVPEAHLHALVDGCCTVCSTPVEFLKGEAVAMVQSLEQPAEATKDARHLAGIVASRNMATLTKNLPVSTTSLAQPRVSSVEQGATQRVMTEQVSAKRVVLKPNPQVSSALQQQAQKYLEKNVIAWLTPQRMYREIINSSSNGLSETALHEHNMSHSRLPVPHARSSAAHATSSALPRATGATRSLFAQSGGLGASPRSVSQGHAQPPPHCSTPIPPLAGPPGGAAAAQLQGQQVSYVVRGAYAGGGVKSHAGSAAAPHSYAQTHAPAGVLHPSKAHAGFHSSPAHEAAPPAHGSLQQVAPHSGLPVSHVAAAAAAGSHGSAHLVYSHTLSGHLSRIPHSGSSGIQAPSSRAYYAVISECCNLASSPTEENQKSMRP
ncbi:PREDICTED: uncharacterized protein LOC106821394 [Priapulus caudatus]|uniref:Uncharacterized protein LOC106821394 n=1 Tax=Priapulus caudatus TaxID=37621 RepID=A0ABM1FB28_PRICU|nr:PREDICTED: uncharacterized protein LOC106821394 [Priapulus caudatus]